MEGNSFKGSLFGGFKRDDVIDYITKSSAESSKKIEMLEGDIEKLCKQERELRTQLSTALEENRTLQSRVEDLSAANDGNEKMLADKSAAYDTLVSEKETLTSEYTALLSEVTALRKEVAELRPQFEQYTAVKSHFAEIELQAHSRADALEANVRSRLCAMIDECRGKCDEVLSTLGETCCQVSSELNRAEQSVSTLPDVFQTLRSGLDELNQMK